MAKTKKKNARRAHARKMLKEFVDFGAATKLPERLKQLLCTLLHISEADWAFCMNKVQQGDIYRELKFSKGPGRGFRTIHNPDDILKKIQRSLLDNFLSMIPIHFLRHGNRRGGSILSNAEVHLGMPCVFGVDLVHAFPSVHRSRIRGALRQPFKRFLTQFGAEVNAELIDEDRKLMLESVVDLLCWHDRLPQGPPSSPRILDIVCYRLDQHLAELMNQVSTPFQRYKISAYADNFTFSSEGEIPEEVQTAIVKMINDHGFIAHTRKDKTEYFSRSTGKVPVVTGLVLTPDRRITMAPAKVNQLRARLHHFTQQEAWSEEDRGNVLGTLGYIMQVYTREKLPSKLKKAVTDIETRIATDKQSAVQSVPEITEVKPKTRKSRAKKKTE